jgi:hypothetical protein
MRRLAVLGLLACASLAHADSVALLPLDGDKRLEIYGQPVASEIGRALEAAGVDVVVVGARMGVPERAQLIVDGTIKAGKADAIALSIRIRDPRDGTVLQVLPATATTLRTIDKAAAELSVRVVPAVKTHLAALATTRAAAPSPAEPERVAPPQASERAAASPSLPILLAAVSSPHAGTPALELLATTTAGELVRWAPRHRRAGQLVDPQRLSRAEAVQTLAQAHQDVGGGVGIAIEILSFEVDPGVVPLARARARVRIVDGITLRYEQVIRTGTIVGDRDITEHELAARTGRELLAMINAELRLRIAGWR